MSLFKLGYQNRQISGIARKLALRIALIGVVLTAIALVLLIPLQRAAVLKKAANEARILAKAVAAIYHSAEKTGDFETAFRLMHRVARAPTIAFANVMDKQGVVLYSTDTAEIGVQYSLRHDSFKRQNYLHETYIISRNSPTIHAVSIAVNLTAVYSQFERFYFELALSLLAVMFMLTILVTWTIERLVSSRLVKLSQVMQDAKKGSFLVRAAEESRDEIGLLARNFNQLLSAITNLQVKEIEREQDLADAHAQLSTKQQLEQSNQRLARRVKAQELLMEVAHQVSGTLNKEQLLARLVTLVRDKRGWPDFVIFWVNEHEDDRPAFLSVAIASGILNTENMRNLTFNFGEGITGRVAQSGVPIVIDDLSKESRIKLKDLVNNNNKNLKSWRNGSMLSVPMLYQGRVIGVMDFYKPQTKAFDDEDVTLLHALGAQVAVAKVNAELYEATLVLTISDPLTGIMNRRAMERQIDAEIARSQRYSTPFALLMVDVDHFKAFNDRMGHVMGDIALKDMAKRLESSVRKVDGVARFGGEEFCVILPQTNEVEALDVAQKLCSVVRASTIKGASAQPLGLFSVSIGIAIYPDDMPSLVESSPLTELVRTADQALYSAKRAGRDRAKLFSEYKKANN